MAKFKTGQIVIYKDEPDLYSIKSVLEFPGSGAFYSIWKIGSAEDPKMVVEQNLTLNTLANAVKPIFNKEDKNMTNRNTTTKTPVHLYNYEDSPEDVEFEKKRKELMDEAEKKILDIRKELAVALGKLDEERFEQEMQRNEAMQAKAWKRKYDALIVEGFTTEQAWEMTMKSFEVD